jgi:tRNA (guanine10-N2)-dimethyltransferase
MRVLLRLSGEHISLPLAEVKAVFEGEGLEYSLDVEDRLVLAGISCEDPSILGRLAYTLQACEVLGESDSLENLAGDVFDLMGDVDSFMVCATKDVAKKFGGVLKRLGWRVDLENPDESICVVEFRGRYVAGIKLDFPRGYEGRRAQHRPYFHPTSMHPKLARCLVNLSRVRKGDILADPFCGTGGILIEAGLMGLELIGSDIDENMVSGARTNLKHYGLDARLSVGDALRTAYDVDAIVTDPPYGRASYTSEKTNSLYLGFLEWARKNMGDDSHMVLMLPSDKKVEFTGFEILESHDFRMHKSLTRRVWVLKPT